MSSFPVQHLSPSSINTFCRCGRQFMYRYLEGLVIPPGISAVRGTAAHTGVEVNLLNMIQTGEKAPIEAVEVACHDKVNSEWEKGVRLLPEEQGQAEGKLRGEAVDGAIRLARTHYQEIAPALHPTNIERWFELDLGDFLPCTIKGRIDLQEGGGIRDLKTKTTYPASDAVERDLQLTWYAMAVHALDGELPDYVSLDHLILTKTGVTYRPQTAKRDAIDFTREIRRAQAVACLIDDNQFQPATPDQWCCTPRWCGYWNRCSFGARQATTVSYAVTGKPASKNGEEESVDE